MKYIFEGPDDRDIDEGPIKDGGEPRTRDPESQNLLPALGLKVPGKAGDRSPVPEGSLLSRQQKTDWGPMERQVRTDAQPLGTGLNTFWGKITPMGKRGEDK